MGQSYITQEWVSNTFLNSVDISSLNKLAWWNVEFVQLSELPLGKKIRKDFDWRKKLPLHCSIVSLWGAHRVYTVRKNSPCLNQINESFI